MDRMQPDVDTHAGTPQADTGEDEAPPLLGRWRNLYLVVFVWLAILIFLFYRFTEYFS